MLAPPSGRLVRTAARGVRTLTRLSAAAAVWTALAGCAATPTSAAPRDALGHTVEDALDDLHRAASQADASRYLEHFAPDAVFMGTDARERWPLDAFAGYVHAHFAAGTGWTYVPFERHVAHAADGRVAWFDERLRHARYGEARGTGVLVLRDGRWRIAHYSLTFPIPNEIAGEVTERIASLMDR